MVCQCCEASEEAGSLRENNLKLNKNSSGALSLKLTIIVQLDQY